MHNSEIFVVRCEIGSILIYCSTSEERLCERIEFSDEQLEETAENIFTSQIKEYLNGSIKVIDFPVSYKKDTKFAHILEQLRERVNYGRIITYADLATICNTTPRVVGFAMASNPLPLYFPCHRVVAKNSLGGFGGRFNISSNSASKNKIDGMKWKKYLLNLEGSI